MVKIVQNGKNSTKLNKMVENGRDLQKMVGLPIHEDATAVIVRVVCQQPVPLVFLEQML
jgi:hypothetical protein